MATEVADQIQELREEVHQRYTGLENALMGHMDAIRLTLERQDEQQKKQEEQQKNMIATMESLQATAGVVKGMVRERVQGIEGKNQGQQQQLAGEDRFYIGDQGAEAEGSGNGNRRTEGHGVSKKFDGKAVAHLKENKFTGK